MANSDIFEGTTFSVSKNVVDFVQCLQSFNYVAKYCMLAIKILDIVAKSDKELTATTATVAINGRGHSHRNSPFMRMLEFGHEFWLEVSRYGVVFPM